MYSYYPARQGGVAETSKAALLKNLANLASKTPLVYPEDVTVFAALLKQARALNISRNHIINTIGSNLEWDLAASIGSQLARKIPATETNIKQAAADAVKNEIASNAALRELDEFESFQQEDLERSVRYAVKQNRQGETKAAKRIDVSKIALRQACETKFFMEKKPFASGTFATVWNACLNPELTDCPYVLRVEGIQDSFSYDPQQITKSIDISKRAGEQGIGPKVFDAWICDDVVNNIKQLFKQPYVYWRHSKSNPYLFTVMEKVEGVTLEDLAANPIPEWVLVEVYKQVNKMHDLGITHHDLHKGNVLVDLKNHKVKIIDYQGATESSEPLTEEERMMEWTSSRIGPLYPLYPTELFARLKAT